MRDKKRFLKALAMACVLSGGLTFSGQPVHAMGDFLNIDVVACEEGEVEAAEATTTEATTTENEVKNEDISKAGETTDEKNVIVKIDETNFPDPVFREAVKYYCDADLDGFLSELEVQNLYEMDLSEKNISAHIQSVKGIEYLTRLQKLDLSNNDIEEIDLSKNTDLEELILTNNNLKTIDLSKNIKIKRLVCSYNFLKSLDTGNLQDLEVLECDNNSIGTLDLSKNLKLKNLYCYWCGMTNLDVSKNTELVILSAGVNGLTQLDVTHNTALENLYCDHNQLTSLDISKNTALVDLECGGNDLGTLDLSNNKSLQRIMCESANLKALDISQNTALTTLNAMDNQIAELDLSKNLELIYLSCNQNKIEKLDVSKNTKLIYLQIYYNPLNKIDIRNCPILIDVMENGRKVVEEYPWENYKTYVSYGNDENLSGFGVDVDDVIVTGAFQDLEKDAWYKEAVLYVKDNAFMNGTSDITFEPNKTLTRAQFATVLYNIEGNPETGYNEKFIDVPENKWYTAPIMWAFYSSVSSGISDNEFGTDSEITREQLATLLYNYARINGGYIVTKDDAALKDFPDTEKVSGWATEAMQWAVSKGVMSGKPGKDGKNILDPKGSASRAECAQMVMNFMTKTSKPISVK